MQPVDPAELSAYLDGELTPDRAREVAALLATDPDLRSSYDELASTDADWIAAASSACFSPVTDIPVQKVFGISRLTFTAIVGMLIALCVTAKTSDTVVWSLTLHAVALALTFTWIVRMAREDQKESG